MKKTQNKNICNNVCNVRRPAYITGAFTLIELIVVITILAILGTIAFISLQGYSAQARDSRRVADINNIKTSLELFSLNTGFYPLPDNKEEIKYNGELLWNQGTIGEQVTSNLSRNLSKKPTDPLFDIEYMYSVTNTKNEFEVLSVHEKNLSYNNFNSSLSLENGLLMNTNASNNYYLKIEGTYNGVFIKTPNYIFPVPTIITSISGSIDFKDSPDAINSMLITGGENFPDLNISNITVQTGGLDINLSVYTGSITKDSTNQEKIDLINVIQNTYSGTILANNTIYKDILSKTTDEEKLYLIDYLITGETKTYVQNSIVTNNLGFSEITDWIEESSGNGTNIANNKVTLSLNDSEYTNDLTLNQSYTHSSALYGSYIGAWAFDDIITGSNGWMTNMVTTNSWIAVEFSNPKKIGKVRFINAHPGNRYSQAKHGKIEASTDGLNWLKIPVVGWSNQATQYNIDEFTLIVDNSSLYRQTILLNNEEFYKYWRVFIYDSYGAQCITLSEVEMMEYLGTNYPIGLPYYITTSNNNNINLVDKTKINSVTINKSQPVGTSIKSLISFDRRNTWKKWNGSMWIDHLGGLDDLQNGNTINEIQAGLSNYILNSETSLDFAFDLSTTDTLYTPEITGIVVTTTLDTSSTSETVPLYASCKEILDNGYSIGDGTYTIDPDDNGVGFETYCDMTTDGGGWILMATYKRDDIGANPVEVVKGTLNYNPYILTESNINNYITLSNVEATQIKYDCQQVGKNRIVQIGNDLSIINGIKSNISDQRTGSFTSWTYGDNHTGAVPSSTSGHLISTGLHAPFGWYSPDWGIRMDNLGYDCCATGGEGTPYNYNGFWTVWLK